MMSQYDLGRKMQDKNKCVLHLQTLVILITVKQEQQKEFEMCMRKISASVFT